MNLDKEREKSKSINDFKRDLEGLIILIETFMEKLEQEKMGIEEPLEIFKYLLSILNRKKEKWEKEVSEIDVSKKQIEDKELINDTIAKYGVAHIINEKTKKTIAIINRSKKEIKITKKSKEDFLKELDDPHLINTYEKIINQSKERLHKFIDDPNSSTCEKAIQNLSLFPFLEGKYSDYYEIHEDRLSEVRDKVNVLAELFMEFYTAFVYRGLEADKRVREFVEGGDSE